MFNTILAFVKSYLSNVFFYLIAALVIAVITLSVMLNIKAFKIALLETQLIAATDKLATQKVELDKLKLLADEQKIKLTKAYEENLEVDKRHAKTIALILSSRLPDTATCEETAKWAKDLARRKK